MTTWMPRFALILAAVFSVSSSHACAPQLNPAETQAEVSQPSGAPATQASEQTSDSTPLNALHPQRIRYAFYSLYFTVIPVSALVFFLILLLHFGRPDAKVNFEAFFGGGQTTQLVVILVIAGNVCSLAFAGIIGGSEVAAIYGGIVGYVLGKDRSRASAPLQAKEKVDRRKGTEQAKTKVSEEAAKTNQTEGKDGDTGAEMPPPQPS